MSEKKKNKIIRYIPATLITYDEDGDELEKAVRLKVRLCTDESPLCVEISLPNEYGIIHKDVIIRFTQWKKLGTKRKLK